MSGPQEVQDKGFKQRVSNAKRDLIILFISTLLVLILSYFFSLFQVIVEFLNNQPNMIVYVDEVVTGLLTLSIGLAIFAWRRWLELKKETTLRIKKQEELLAATATQAEVERIIGKQMRSDMDQMKDNVREILAILSRRA